MITESTPAQAAEILRRHGLPEAEPVRAEREGIVHAIWLCGDFVVRILKNSEEMDDVLTESDAAPAAWAAGVLTPRPIAFAMDDSPPYSIFERAPGVTLAATQIMPNPSAFFRAYGAEVRRMHTLVGDLPRRHLDEAWIVEPGDVAAHGPEFAALVQQLPWQPAREMLFVHQDLHAENVMVHQGALSAILDWGDAGFGDPACDLRYVPARHLPDAWEGYGADKALKVRSLLHALDQFAYCRQMGRSYGVYGDSTWPDLADLVERLARSEA